MRKMILFFCLCCGLSYFCLSVNSAFAVKQKYERRYQKKTAVFQKKTPYVQEKNLPDAGSYFEVSRKKPQVKTEYQPQETIFKTDGANVVCRGENTFSCTFFKANFETSVDCEDSRIVLKVTEPQKMTVALSSLYPKGSCPFDLILKHELLHVDIYRKTLNGFIKRTEQNLADKYRKGQTDSKGCKEIQKRIAALTESLAKNYSEEAAVETAKLDREDGSHKYGFEACKVQTEKTGEKQE